jgi:hypothetical protein
MDNPWGMIGNRDKKWKENLGGRVQSTLPNFFLLGNLLKWLFLFIHL